MIQKFLCPKCGNAFEVPVEGFGVGDTEVDCPCGASMVPHGGLEHEVEEPPHRDKFVQRQGKLKRVWQFIALLLVLSFLGYLVF